MSWLPKFFHPRTKAPGGTAQYHPAVFYPVGSENQVYEPAPPVFAAMLPVVWFTGAAIPAGHAPNLISRPMLYSNPTVQVAGVGGPAAGAIIGAPLNVFDSTDGEQ